MANTKQGKTFEQSFKESCEKTGFYFMRLVDSVKWGSAENSTFTPSNIADSILHTSPILWLFELKSTQGASISFFPNTPWIKPKDCGKTAKMIKPSQVKSLLKASEVDGNMCCFIFNFRPRQLKSGETENKTYCVSITDFIEFAQTSGKSSISIEDCEKIGIEIESSIKKVTYAYSIKKFLDEAIPFYLNNKQINADYIKRTYSYIKVLFTAVQTQELRGIL